MCTCVLLQPAVFLCISGICHDTDHFSCEEDGEETVNGNQYLENESMEKLYFDGKSESENGLAFGV